MHLVSHPDVRKAIFSVLTDRQNWPWKLVMLTLSMITFTWFLRSGRPPMASNTDSQYLHSMWYSLTSVQSSNKTPSWPSQSVMQAVNIVWTAMPYWRQVCVKVKACWRQDCINSNYFLTSGLCKQQWLPDVRSVCTALPYWRQDCINSNDFLTSGLCKQCLT